MAPPCWQVPRRPTLVMWPRGVSTSGSRHATARCLGPWCGVNVLLERSREWVIPLPLPGGVDPKCMAGCLRLDTNWQEPNLTDANLKDLSHSPTRTELRKCEPTASVHSTEPRTGHETEPREPNRRALGEALEERGGSLQKP